MIFTERLSIRPFIEADAPLILELVNDPDWLRFIGDRQVRTLEDARGYLLRGPIAATARDGHSLMHVSLQSNRGADVPIGMCGLIKRDSLAQVDLGFALLPAYRGKGYAREAAVATLAHGRRALGIERVVAITQPGNFGSIQVLEAVGMRFDSWIRLPDDPTELALYVLDRAEQGA